MVRALGFFQSAFDPDDPGRLCRSRERWVEAPDGEDGGPVLHRVVLSGAAFTDDSARDARRGLPAAGVGVGAAVRGLFPKGGIVAAAEDAPPGRIPAEAEGVEVYALRRLAGPLREWGARWSMVCADAAAVDRAVEAGADVLLVVDTLPPTDAAATLPGEPRLADDPPPHGGLPAPLRGALFYLQGMRADTQPPRRFQATGIRPLLAGARAVVLLHEDKHGPAVAVYTEAPLSGVDGVVQRLAAQAGALHVPFAIPPMLARWDRAVFDLRQTWDEAAMGEFPVPPAAEGGWGRWRPRHRRGARGAGGSGEE
jgi:hypothetical protein